MHGVRRGTRPTAEVAAEREQIAREQAALVRRALTLRRARDFSEDALTLVARVLTNNPDEYSLWAYRREALLHLVAKQAKTEGSGDSRATDALEVAEEEVEEEELQDERKGTTKSGNRVNAVLDRWKEEIDLSLVALKRHPKAYPAWQHRVWLLSACEILSVVPETAHVIALRQELNMSSLLLSQDGRNFHGWAHRMRIREVAPELVGSLSDELNFVTTKINEDFANYSAWHHRSALLPVLNSDHTAFIASELEFVRQAFYTDPDVQSAWFYHRWLLAGAPGRNERAYVDLNIYDEELHACAELLQLEPDARFALLAKADLLVKLGRRDLAIEVFDRLCSLDPMRRGYYGHQRSKLTSYSTNDES